MNLSAPLATVTETAEFGDFLSPVAFWTPERLVPSAWMEHGPFAFWLIEAVRPRVFVELGSYAGYSHAAFCQAVQHLAVGTACYAIDTWAGDEHGGFYQSNVYDEFKAYNDARYKGFSTLIRATFNDALLYFPDGSIDLLHIDGRHFYEDVKEDYENWLPKLSDRAVVLFHDTNVRERDFGVFRLWQELKGRFPSFEFKHGNGLGVLGVGARVPSGIVPLFRASATQAEPKIRAVYAGLGNAVQARYDLSQARTAHLDYIRGLEERNAALKVEIAALQEGVASKVVSVAAALPAESAQSDAVEAERARIKAALQAEHAQADAQLQAERHRANAANISTERAREQLEKVLVELEEAHLQCQHAAHAQAMLAAEIEALRQSTSWRATGPLRRLARYVPPAAGGLARKAAKMLYWVLTPHRIPARLRWREEQEAKVRAADVAVAAADTVAEARAEAEVQAETGAHAQVPALFDTQWYLAKYPEVAADPRSPFQHYLEEGATRGFNPNPLFDSSWYLHRHSDVAAVGMNPLAHYIEWGGREGRDPHPLFDTKWYFMQVPELVASGGNPLEHFLQIGDRRGLSPNRLFRSAWYLRQNPEAARSDLGAFRHYLEVGAAQGRQPNAIFDGAWYLCRYPDVAHAGLDPLTHFLAWGAEEGRAPSAHLDPHFYAVQVGLRGRSTIEIVDHYLDHQKPPGVFGTLMDVDPDKVGQSLGAAPIEPTKPLAVVVGIVIYNETPQQISRIVRSTQRAMSRCDPGVTGQVRIFDNGGFFDPSKLPQGVHFIPSGLDEGFAVGHSKLSEGAFKDGADVYIGANPDGAFHPDCIRELLRMNATYQGEALIEAMQFPDEHPKFYHPETLETPWISCACFLMSRRVWETTGGFDRNIYLYCDDVDLSWSARHHGFSTRICASALFYHDVSDRGHDRWRHREMLVSARYLGHKWSNPAFTRWAEQQLIELKYAAHLGELPPLDDLPVVPGGEKVADFSHHFHFAPARW